MLLTRIRQSAQPAAECEHMGRHVHTHSDRAQENHTTHLSYPAARHAVVIECENDEGCIIQPCLEIEHRPAHIMRPQSK